MIGYIRKMREDIRACNERDTPEDYPWPYMLGLIVFLPFWLPIYAIRVWRHRDKIMEGNL